MPQILRSALLPYSARQVFDLVNDVESYPQFMEGCVGARVLRREAGLMEARLELSRGGIAQAFTTVNTLSEPEAIDLALKDGPFERFQGQWRFQALGEAACKVTLQLDFSFSHALIGAAAGRLFERATNGLVDAVVRRARTLYGQPRLALS